MDEWPNYREVKKLQTNIHMNTMVVYICASLLQLAFKSCDASQTEKKKYFCHHLSNSLNDKYFHSNGQNLSFYVIFCFCFCLFAQLWQRSFFSAWDKSSDLSANCWLLEQMKTIYVLCIYANFSLANFDNRLHDQ